MQIKQFEDKNLSHYSYAILSDREKKIIVIDPARNTTSYIDYAKNNNAQISGIIETHPHADFVSSHLELHNLTGAIIYASKLVNACYPHQTFDEGESIQLDGIRLCAINTPGHSPDSICILLEYDGKQKAVFTGDTLFIGDCGRPDLREDAGTMHTTRIELAKQMYYSLREKLMRLKDDVLVYPAHGAGTLCGKHLSNSSSSTIAKEKQTNWCLQEASESEFVNNLLEDQPFVPYYFPFDVEVNRKGAGHLYNSITKIKITKEIYKKPPDLDETFWVIDSRDESDYKSGHLPHSINLMEEGKFETWLGSIIKPGEKFYLTAANNKQLQNMLQRTASIGYENQVIEGFIIKDGYLKQDKINIEHFRNNIPDYTIIDVRNNTEVNDKKIFSNSISIPLAEMRDRVNEIPIDKPIVVHCSGGYRSAAASSLLQSTLKDIKVLDLGKTVEQFQ